MLVEMLNFQQESQKLTFRKASAGYTPIKYANNELKSSPGIPIMTCPNYHSLASSSSNLMVGWHTLKLKDLR
jgi:hypothetical protein